MRSRKRTEWKRTAVAVALLVVPVAACDSASDGAVVTSQAATGVVESDQAEVAAAPMSGKGERQGNRAGRSRGEAADSAQPGSVVDTEQAALLLMREEEKLARDVYLAMGEVWGLRIFDNIASSEQQHMDAVLELLDAHGIEDPVGDNGRGVFTDNALQDLYDNLVAKGAASKSAALLVGATIEDLDIRDLRFAIEASADPEVDRVLGNLERASLNHLQAFSRQLERNGATYTPQYMEAAEYEDVVAAAPGRGKGGRGS